METYNLHINSFDVAFLALAGAGLTFVLLLGFTRSDKRAANRFAALVLSVIFLSIARVLALDFGLGADHLPLQFSLALGPLLFFYVRQITDPGYTFRLKDLFHFCPLLPKLVVQALGLREANSVLQVMTLLSAGIYLYLSFKRINHFYGALKFAGGDRFLYQLRWLDRLLKIFAVLWLIGVAVTARDLFYGYEKAGRNAEDWLYLFVAAWGIAVGAAAFIKSAVNQPAETPAHFKPPLLPEFRQKGNWLKHAMKTGLYYQDPELSLAALAERLGLHTHELSRIINTVLKKSFNDFVNEYRVAEVARKMQNATYNHLTLLGIAYESGFNSKSTFNRIFKQLTGVNPVTYKNSLKKERPSYNLGPSSRYAGLISFQQSTIVWTYEKLNRYYMFRNYLKTAARNLSKNKGFTLTNILGLSVGLACFLLIAFYVFDELSYDRYQVKGNRIFRVNTDIKFGGNETSNATAPAPFYSAVKNDFPEIEKVARIYAPGSLRVKEGEHQFTEDKVAYADSTLFEVFTLPSAGGNTVGALVQSHSVVITESTAARYFHAANPIGKILTFNDADRYMVTAVIRDLPPQSHFNYDFFLSMATLPESRQDSWLNPEFNTYVLLRPGAVNQKFEAKLPDFLKVHAGPQLMGMMHISFNQFESAGNYFRFNLTPLADIHLHSNRLSELAPNGNMQYIYIFSAIALFILVIACVNFMNLSTASSSKRAREVGVRKVLGSARKHLVIQFLTESTLVALAAALIGLIGAWLLLPLFNELSGKTLLLTPAIFGWLVPVLSLLVLAIGLLAGAYPAFFLSAFQPVDVLKGKLAAGFKGGALRGFLVVFQFAVSIFLIIATLVIYQQLHFIQSKDLGYNRDEVLTIRHVEELGNQAKTFREEVKKIAGVQEVTLTSDLPTSDARNGVPVPMFKDSVPDPKRAVKSQVWSVDEDYIPTLGIKMISGRNFSREMLTDSSKMIINEAAAKLFGITDPSGQKIYEPQDNGANNLKPYHVIGIMKDFNYKSLRENITPLCFILKENRGALSMKINTGNIPLLLTQVKAQWAGLSPGQPMVYSFMDDDFDALYRSEQRMGSIFVTFTAMAIFIACLGLFALAAYAADQRTKEIGIRKVMGAGVATIAFMLSIDFIKLVLIAIVIAVPLAWWTMHSWLQEFAYRQSLSPWLFALAGASAILIAVLTVSFQAIKAALINPVRSLRN